MPGHLWTRRAHLEHVLRIAQRNAGFGDIDNFVDCRDLSFYYLLVPQPQGGFKNAPYADHAETESEKVVRLVIRYNHSHIIDQISLEDIIRNLAPIALSSPNLLHFLPQKPETKNVF